MLFGCASAYVGWKRTQNMQTRYHIETRPAAPPPTGYPASFAISEDAHYVKYGHPVFEGQTRRGDEYWTAEIITQTWYQAETGRIPISGAGYGGKFAGEGFEGIWLDMSEIVRPTRDGIHGREYISTQVDLGASANRLEFDSDGRLASQPEPWLSLPLPIIFNALPQELPGRGGVQAIAAAASELGLISIINPTDYSDDIRDYSHTLAPRFDASALESIPDTWSPQYVEVEDKPENIPVRHITAHQRWPGAIIGVRLALANNSAATAVELVKSGVRVLHLFADDVGRDEMGRPLPDALREVHTRLVEASLRDQVTIIASGGIAAAEHVAKAIACGADLVAIDFAVLIAWGCSLWADKGACPAEDGEIDPLWGVQRLVNLMNAWRDQLLEALGAMGMREVRRLRGESGRTIWQRTEEEAFRSILGGGVPESHYRR